MNENIFYVYDKFTHSEISDDFKIVLSSNLKRKKPLYAGRKVYYTHNFFVLIDKDNEIVYHSHISINIPKVSQRAALRFLITKDRSLLDNLTSSNLEDYAAYFPHVHAQKYFQVEPYEGTKGFVCVGYGVWVPLDELGQDGNNYSGICLLGYSALASNLAEAIGELRMGFPLHVSHSSQSQPTKTSKSTSSLAKRTNPLAMVTSVSQFVLPPANEMNYWDSEAGEGMPPGMDDECAADSKE